MREKIVSQFLTDALFELLKTKELHEITTTELIRKAGVCRSSYYRNYYYLDDILKEYLDGLFRSVPEVQQIRSGELLSHVQQFYQICLSERERLAILYRRGLFHLLDEPVYDHCSRMFADLGHFEIPYELDFYTGAAVFLLRAWVRNGFRESPEEIAGSTCDAMRGLLKDAAPAVGR